MKVDPQKQETDKVVLNHQWLSLHGKLRTYRWNNLLYGLKEKTIGEIEKGQVAGENTL